MQFRNAELHSSKSFIELLKQLIPIRCSVKKCPETQENYSIPVQLEDLIPPKKAIIFVCPKHHKQQNEEIRIGYSFLQNQIIKQLKPVKKQDYDLQLYQANNKLDTNACCMRENAKTLNLEKLFTLLQLFSMDDQKLFQLIKKSYIQQYFMYNELKQKIKQAPNNPLAILHLIHLKDQLKAQLRKNWENIAESTIILQPKNNINEFNDQQNQIILGKSLIITAIQSKE